MLKHAAKPCEHYFQPKMEDLSIEELMSALQTTQEEKSVVRTGSPLLSNAHYFSHNMD